MTVQAHADAVLALLNTGALSGVVHDGRVPDGTAPPYVVVYIPGEAAGSTRLSATSDRYIARVYCHSVGDNAAAARAVAEQVRTKLLDVTPAVTGRTCWPIRHEQSIPPMRDETTGRLVMDQVDVWRLESTPA